MSTDQQVEKWVEKWYYQWTLNASVVCGTVMIYCGFGSDFGEVPVPFSVPVLVPDPDNIFSTVFQQQQNLLEAAGCASK